MRMPWSSPVGASSKLGPDMRRSNIRFALSLIASLASSFYGKSPRIVNFIPDEKSIEGKNGPMVKDQMF